MNDKSIKWLLILVYVLVVVRIVIFVLNSLLLDSMGLAIPSRPTLSDFVIPLIDSVYLLLIFCLSIYTLYKIVRVKFLSKLRKRIFLFLLFLPTIFSLLFGIDAFYSAHHQFIEYQNRDSWTLDPEWDTPPVINH